MRTYGTFNICLTKVEEVSIFVEFNSIKKISTKKYAYGIEKKCFLDLCNKSHTININMNEVKYSRNKFCCDCKMLLHKPKGCYLTTSHHNSPTN